MKTRSTFFDEAVIDRIRGNAKRFPWAKQMADCAVTAARPWLKYSDEELRAMMFDATIKRSWMVWSNGHCPACKESVPMYTWIIDPFTHPWKVQCPHCQMLFPNADFPDDGDGYVEGENRWRFIGTYLIYGQWKKLIVAGIHKLAEAYVVSREKLYAHKAGVLLDRVADFYPMFDFKEQGVLFEGPALRGYISTWHDACEEVRHLAMAYDQIFAEIPVESQRKIEERILRETITHREKIQSNFPRTDVAVALMSAILDWPENKADLYKHLDEVITRATKADGLTGEKGLSHYSCTTMQGLAVLLAMMDRLDEGFLARAFEQHPNLRQTFRFHIDTRCLNRFYPNVGDSAMFANAFEHYHGVDFVRPGAKVDLRNHSVIDLMDRSALAPSMYRFFWRLYESTGDAAYVQVLHEMNERSVEALPHDLTEAQPEKMQREVAEVIAREGPTPKVDSVNKSQWRLAILRAGEGENARALWLDYDVTPKAGHAHFDGMNIGLFAKGQDLLPDFGYPPVQYGGWESPRAHWYLSTAAHNTVVVDDANQSKGLGELTLWQPGEKVQVMRASCPEMIGGTRYERTVAMVSIDDENFYVVDIFRVTGGRSHTNCFHSQFGPITTTGLRLSPSEPILPGAEMRNFSRDSSPQPAWTVQWKIGDVSLRRFDLTENAEAILAEAWISVGGFNETKEAWIPRVMTRRTGDGPLDSTFISIIEPGNRIESAKKDGAAIEVILLDGTRDMIHSDDQRFWVERIAGGEVKVLQ